jgi:hypothetical protein
MIRDDVVHYMYPSKRSMEVDNAPRFNHAELPVQRFVQRKTSLSQYIPFAVGVILNTFGSTI